jgi:type I restriction enzyme S subunit
VKVKAVPSSWIQTEGRRLDVGPFLFGAVEARERIRRLDAPKQPLKALTAGPGGGIFNGPQFSRLYVTDPAHGVPFLGSSSMLLADLSHLPLLSRKYADSPKLRHLEVQPGMTLISCSGTIGRMVYARPDMAGMWASQHIMKVCPDPARIPPGYLYAFLSSRFGVPMVAGGTYGAII